MAASYSTASFEEDLAKYTHLIIHSGVNLQQGQELFIGSDIANAQLVRLLVTEAYAAGAIDVTVRWTDEQVSRTTYDNRPLEAFKKFPEWRALQQNSIAKRGAALLFIDSEDPMGMAGVDPRKSMEFSKAANAACKDWRRGMDFGLNVWCIVGASAPRWAVRVFPDLSMDEAVARLWDLIFKTVFVDTPDPDATWAARRDAFRHHMDYLNSLHLNHLHYVNSIGTDITVGLNEKGLWEGGGATTQSGTFFFPNMPTEEVFTSPDFRRVDGTVHSSMPLNHDGSIIDDFSITFKDGRVTTFSATQGQDVLEQIIATDEGSHYLGECALVPRESPIHQSGTLFLSTLYDENATCHFALGMGFPDCYDGGFDMSKEELEEAGVNQSATHVDFMLGTDDLTITGYTTEGVAVPIFEDGTWASA
jgi:aminopeptidase